MKLASFDALISALHQAGVYYHGCAVRRRADPGRMDSGQGADRPQDRIDIEYLRKRLEDGGGI